MTATVTSVLGAGAMAPVVYTVPLTRLWPAVSKVWVIVPGGPDGVPVAVNVTGLPVRPSDVAVSVLVPAGVPSAQDVTGAMPFASVVIGAVGSTVPAPEAMAKVTVTPATGLLAASRTITAGGVATAVPTGALWLFPAWMAIKLLPAVPVAVNVTGLPLRPLDVPVNMFSPP